MTLLSADRLLSSIVRHLRADNAAALASYRYEDCKAAMGAIELVKSAHLGVRADILNTSAFCLTAADVPACYPGFENNAPLV